MSGNSRANKIVISNEPIKLIVKNKEIRKDMMASSRPKENITYLLTAVLVADKVQFKTKLLNKLKNMILLINVIVPEK